MQVSYKTPIWLYPEPVDFRKQIDGLIILIADALSLMPTSGELFIFRNRSGGKIKLLWYDGRGFWLCYYRLERGKLKFPGKNESVMELTHDQLSWLLSGIDFTKQTALPKTEAKNFF
jgi:transposase